MKKLFLFCTSLAIAAGMWSCGPDDNGNTPPPVPDATLELTPSDDIEFDAEGGSVTIAVTTNQDIWESESDSDWCVVTKGDGEFTIEAEVNTTEEAMPEATVTVTAGEGDNVITKTIKVNQLSVNATDIPVEYYMMANLHYFEERSLPELGYYQLMLSADGGQSEAKITTVAFWHDVIPNQSQLNKFPKGTFTIDPDSESAKFHINPGTGTIETKQNGSYMMHVMMGTPHHLLLMKSGTMTIGGEGNNVTIDIDFVAEDSVTGEESIYRGHYSYNGAGLPPLYTYITATEEQFSATFTRVKSATLGDTGNGSSYASVILTDNNGANELKFIAFIAENSTILPDGTYTFAPKDTFTPGTLMPGEYYPTEGALNTYYLGWNTSTGSIDTSIPATEGTMTVTSQGGVYDIDFDFKGLNERKLRKKASFTGSYNGPIYF